MASHTVSSTEGRLADSHLTCPRIMQLWTTSLLVYEQRTSPRAGPQRFSLCPNTGSDLGIQRCSEIAFASSFLVIEDRPGMSARFACSYSSALLGSPEPAPAPAPTWSARTSARPV